MRQEDQLEFEGLFRAFYPTVVRTVYLVLHDRGQAEDVSQAAFLKLFEHWRTVSRYERPQAWVRRVAIRMAVRHVHRERARWLIERAPRDTREEGWPDVDLAHAIATLTPMQRAAVVLYYLEDLPVSEIAEVLQVSDSTVKQHLFRARGKLATELAEEVAEDVR